MQITIWSHWRDETWTGDVPIVFAHPESALERIWRKFNRLTDADCEYLLAIGYELPSLSVGDKVTMDGVTWVCAPMGWVQEGSPEEACDTLLAIHRGIEKLPGSARDLLGKHLPGEGWSVIEEAARRGEDDATTD